LGSSSEVGSSSLGSGSGIGISQSECSLTGEVCNSSGVSNSLGSNLGSLSLSEDVLSLEVGLFSQPDDSGSSLGSKSSKICSSLQSFGSVEGSSSGSSDSDLLSSNSGEVCSSLGSCGSSLGSESLKLKSSEISLSSQECLSSEICCSSKVSLSSEEGSSP